MAQRRLIFVRCDVGPQNLKGSQVCNQKQPERRRARHVEIPVDRIHAAMCLVAFVTKALPEVIGWCHVSVFY